MIKKCIVCGKEFEPFFSAPHQKTCCEECRKEYYRQKSRAEYAAHKEECLKKSRNWRKKNRTEVRCIICGRPVYREYDENGRMKDQTRMHEGCVIDDLIDTIAEGKAFSGLQWSRMHNRGLTRADLIKDYKDEILEQTLTKQGFIS